MDIEGERLSTRRGTPVYMAPEVILKDYDPKVDCWSAGVLIFQLLHGRLPYMQRMKGHSVRDVWDMILNSGEAHFSSLLKEPGETYLLGVC